MNKKTISALAFSLATLFSGLSFAGGQPPRKIGEVETSHNVLMPNHKIRVEAFNDPNISGITCYASEPVAGGMDGLMGTAEERSEVGIACRQTGPVCYNGDVSGQVEVLNESRSAWFKQLHVTRMFDKAANTFVYLTWSNYLTEGSAHNSISAVTPMPWDGQTPGPCKAEKAAPLLP